jgi:hypothetical protein
VGVFNHASIHLHGVLPQCIIRQSQVQVYFLCNIIAEVNGKDITIGIKKISRYENEVATT